MSEMRIIQTKGPGRGIVLRGASLVYVDRQESGISFGREQRAKIKYPPGAPVATVQVIGSVYKPLEMRGRWDDKKLADPRNSADLIGFPPLANLLNQDYARQASSAVSSGTSGQQRATRARVLANAFDLLLMEGMELRVEWANYVRFGILTDFDPQPVSEETIFWTATFTWMGQTNATPRVKKKPKLDPQSLIDQIQGYLNKATTALTDVSKVAPLYASYVLAPMNQLVSSVQSMVSAMLAFIKANDPRPFYSSVRAAITKVKISALLVYQTLMRVLGNDDPMSQREREQSQWMVVNLRKDILDLAAAMAERERALAEIQEQSVVATVVMAEGDTLRSLADKYYKDQKLWTLIADFNGLTKSVQPIRTVVLIPAKE